MRRLFVKVKTGVTHPDIEYRSDRDIIVRVSEHAHGGQANAAVIKALADYFDCAPSRIIIKKGVQSKQKRIELT